MKTFWFFNHYASTPDQPSTSAFFVGRELVRRGNRVTFFASAHNYYFQRRTKGRRWSLWSSETVEGVTFVWISTTPASARPVLRMVNMLSYAIVAFLAGLFRRERPDYVIMWGWGVMNAVAIQEAANIRFPMENFIGIWWSGSENDVRPAGQGAHGYKSLAMHGTGRDYPVYDDIQQYVIDRGLAAGAGDQVGTVMYSRGLYAAMLAVEAAKVAQEIHGVAEITPAMMRDGMANLVISEELMEELGLPNFGPAFEVSCQNHGGTGQAMIQQWDANEGTWNLITDWIMPDRDLIMEMVMEDSMAYAAENNIEPQCLERSGG